MMYVSHAMELENNNDMDPCHRVTLVCGGTDAVAQSDMHLRGSLKCRAPSKRRQVAHQHREYQATTPKAQQSPPLPSSGPA